MTIRAAPATNLPRLLRERFGVIPGLRSTRTTIVLGTLKESARLALVHPDGGNTHAA